MCRLFGTLSSQLLDAGYPLRTAPQSLVRQSAVDRRRLQGDGWGLGWFDNRRPQVFKSPLPIYRDKLRVIRAARQASGRVLIGHIRWASNPMKLPEKDLIGQAHTQPFLHDRWLFAHNGTLYIPREAAAALGPWARHLRGRNDSEVLFYWLLKHLMEPLTLSPSPRGEGRVRGLIKAIRQSIRGLHALWEPIRKRYPLYRFPYHGLNWVLTNGLTLFAFCYVDPGGFGKSKALCRRGQPYYQMQVRQTPNSLTVASEPLDPQPGWIPMRHGELLTARRVGSQIVARRQRVC